MKLTPPLIAFGKLLWALVCAVGVLARELVDLLASGCGESGYYVDSYRDPKNKSAMMGEYNFRTNKLDDGLDPYGWYEEDM